jgi:hypothetical protein
MGAMERWEKAQKETQLVPQAMTLVTTLPVDMALHKYMSNLPDYTVEIYASC